MKVLDLRCFNHHVFEGWFGSEADFQEQLGRGLVQCPMCNDARISKVLTAARLNLSRANPPRSDPDGAADDSPAPKPVTTHVPDSSTSFAADVERLTLAALNQMSPEALSAFKAVVREIADSVEDVGPEFASEARRMHYGKAPERNIRGQASADDAAALLDEGIEVLPFFLPEPSKPTRH